MIGAAPPSAIFVAVIQGLSCLAALAAWFVLHRYWTTQPRPAMAVRGALLALAAWLAIELVGRVVVLNRGLTQVAVSILAGTSIELMIALFSRERATLLPQVARRLLALRAFLLLLLLAVLLQPVFTFERTVRKDRFVAVLVDESASMDLGDPQSSVSEKLHLARLYGLPFAKPNPLQTVPDEIASLRKELESQGAVLAAIGNQSPEATAAAIRRRREPAGKLLERLTAKLKAVRTTLGEAIEGPAKNRPPFQEVRGAIDPLLASLEAIEKQIEVEPDAALAGGLGGLQNQWKSTVEALRKLELQLAPLPLAYDEALAASLGGSETAELDRLAKTSRSANARRALTHAAQGKTPLIEDAGKNHPVRLYRFAAAPKGTEAAAWQAEPGPPDEKASQWRQATDLASAMSLAMQDTPPDQLAGVLVVSDGRHNRGSPAEPLARRLGQAGVPVASIVLGSKLPPRDAALTDASCPETVFLEDKVAMNVHLRAVGMKGRDVTVRLVYHKLVVDSKTVSVAEDEFRTLVPLGHTPKELGIHSYQIELEPGPGDFIKENNKLERHVAVTDSRIKLLLADDRPRWEFRYVRNLYAGRDKTVQLQHVLLHPDRLAGAEPPAPAPASASRPYGEFEATALPDSPQEWLKFEAIVLGDLPPSALGEETLAALEKFVAKQGGTLIVIAGPNSMPHAYAGTPLAAMLPATFAAGPVQPPEAAYRLCLSPEGGSHTIMRVRANPTDNAATWNNLPPMDWRHPVEQLKPGATVLAYAEPVDPATAYAPPSETEPPPRTESRRSDTERMRLQRQNPLIVVHKYGAGNVLLLAFDRTWRLRYRVGDTYHHRFWSQVLRWATANKLSAGTRHVRLGTDRYRYAAGESVIVRAQLLDEKDSSVSNAKVVVRVYQGNQAVLKKTLAYVPESQGLYQGDLGPLPGSGVYRIEVEGSEVARLLALENASKVQTEVLVTAMEPTAELVDTSADWRLPVQLAELSGGKAVGPADAREVLDLFKAGSKDVRQRRNIALWDSWPAVLLILGVVISEWIVRKKAGLV